MLANNEIGTVQPMAADWRPLPGEGRPVPLRRRPGSGQDPLQRGEPQGRPGLHQRPQDVWAQGRWRPLRAPQAAGSAGAHHRRRWPRERDALGHASTSPESSGWVRRPSWVARDGRRGTPGWPRCAIGSATGIMEPPRPLLPQRLLEPTACRATSTLSFAFVEGEALMMALKDVAVQLRLRLHLGLPGAQLRASCLGRRGRAGPHLHPLRAGALQHRGGGRLRGSTSSRRR